MRFAIASIIFVFPIFALTDNVIYPSAAFAPSGNVIDITQPPYNADPTGVTDSTAAFQAAFTATVNKSSYLIYLPNGTYTVSDTISYTGPFIQCSYTSSHRECVSEVRFPGQSQNGVTIKLVDNAPGLVQVL